MTCWAKIQNFPISVLTMFRFTIREIVLLTAVVGLALGCRSTPSSAPSSTRSNTSSKRPLSFSSEEELADFLAVNAPIGCDSATAKSRLELHGFTCTNLNASGRPILYCSREERVDTFLFYTYVAELEVIEGRVTAAKAKIWGVGP